MASRIPIDGRPAPLRRGPLLRHGTGSPPLRSRARPRAFHSAALGALALLVISPAHLRSADSLVDLPAFREGCLALAEGKPLEAVPALLEAWRTLDRLDAAEIERELVASRLLESWVRSSAAGAAVAWLEESSLVNPSAETLRWAALALHAEGRLSDAALAYADLAAMLPEGLDRTLSLNRAQVLASLGETKGAFAILESLDPPQEESERLPFAHIALLAGEPESALGWIELPGLPMREATLGSDPSFHGLALRTACLHELGDSAGAARELVESLAASVQGGEPGHAHQLFLLLESLFAASPSLDREALLAPLLSQDPGAASPVSAFFTGLLLAGDRTESHLAAWAGRGDEPQLSAEASLRLAVLGEAPDSGRRSEPSPFRDEDASAPDPDDPSATPATRTRRAFLAASLHYRAEEFADSAERFRDLATALRNPELRFRATGNEALASLRGGDHERFERALASLRAFGRETGPIADLEHAAALALAATDDPRAADRMLGFLRDHPDHPAAPEVKLALIEINLNQVPARTQSARELQQRLGESLLPLDQIERLDYLGVWLEILEDEDDGIAPRGEAFLRDWPSSAYGDEIAMLLARHYFEAKRLSSAAEQFQRVASEGSDYAAIASFFAARCAPTGEARLAAWGELAEQGSSPFLPQAKHAKALQALQLDRFDEARALLLELAEGEPADSPLRHAVLADLAYSHFAEALALGTDPGALERAAEAYAQVSSLGSASPAIRYSAAVRRGKCLELLARRNVALEIYHSIVNDSAGSGDFLDWERDPSALDWIYRAGFSAIRLLSEDEDWRAAIRTAETLARKGGPRSLEAHQLAERLRLRHWVWE